MTFLEATDRAGAARIRVEALMLAMSSAGRDLGDHANPLALLAEELHDWLRDLSGEMETASEKAA